MKYRWGIEKSAVVICAGYEHSLDADKKNFPAKARGGKDAKNEASII